MSRYGSIPVSGEVDLPVPRGPNKKSPVVYPGESGLLFLYILPFWNLRFHNRAYFYNDRIYWIVRIIF